MRTSLTHRSSIQNQHSIPYCAITNHELMHFTSVEELHYTAATVNAGNNRISICKSVVTPKVTHNPAHFKVNLNKNILACMITCSIVM